MAAGYASPSRRAARFSSPAHVLPHQSRRAPDRNKNMLKAGDLRESFAFDRRLDQNDGYGNTQSGWVEQFRCAARKVVLRGTESVMAQRLQGVQPVVITIRSSATSRLVTTDWRARDLRTGEMFNIRTVTPSEDRAAIDILAEKGVASG